jgi:hypothetical protein
LSSQFFTSGFCSFDWSVIQDLPLPHQTKSPAAQCNKAFVVVVSVFIGPFRAGIGTVPFQVGCRTVIGPDPSRLS